MTRFTWKRRMSRGGLFTLMHRQILAAPIKECGPCKCCLAAMGGCSSIDVINILKKQKQPLRDFKVTITGEREKDVVPSLFTEVHAHFRLYGDLDAEKVQKAIVLGVEKYCSVAKTLEYKARITHSFEIIK